eukprot:CAMPEP_0119094080 /NCGR_PEP_ID=MMETSP1178-20130426/165110_1 /TAXON_ID=33656 /ORGANISM="unid sp, Strain CCMP2000" /LENGTH=101 /DNA_ID=CAMNT_0007077785 /DNA_START=24 /DNA_END=329 /DNA_ORIENTATION=+
MNERIWTPIEIVRGAGSVVLEGSLMVLVCIARALGCGASRRAEWRVGASPTSVGAGRSSESELTKSMTSCVEALADVVATSAAGGLTPCVATEGPEETLAV